MEGSFLGMSEGWEGWWGWLLRRCEGPVAEERGEG